MRTPKILVVGSLVMDMIIYTSRVPNEGETVLGETFTTAPGGKGANQAVQAARLGARVAMIGKLGTDAFGDRMIESVGAAGVDTSRILRDAGAATGVSDILLEPAEGGKTKNRIIVVSGANMKITPQDVAFLENEIKEYDIVMMQNEIPMQINELVTDIAYRNGVKTMLNPAPSAPLGNALLARLDYISPNEHEAADITGVNIGKKDGKIDLDAVKAAAHKLLEKGVKNVIITLGSHGVAFVNQREFYYKPIVDILEVKDPTAAGDSFVAAFCTAICGGMDYPHALDYASYAATITVSRLGAQPSLPTSGEVKALMDKDGYKA